MTFVTTRVLGLCLVLSALLAIGCQPSAKAPDADDHSHAAAKSGHTHGEWWCAEHGVPEEVCGQCNTKLAAQFQKDGDWCREHDRPDSQCFICHPEHAAKFAAQYEAKYGKQPPQPN